MLIAAGVAALAFAGTSAFAQTTTRVVDNNGRTVEVKTVETDRADRNFIEKVARAGLDEVAISKVAVERSSNPDVRRFAQKIVSDHENLHSDLASLATLKHVSLPAKDNVAEKWQKRDAKDFDRDYVNHMVSAHEDTVKLFEKQSTESKDPEVMEFARKHLEKLQAHLHAATDLQRTFK